MNEHFNNLPWHDAELLGVKIDFAQNEDIEVYIKWPDMETGEFSIIKFIESYAFNSNINLGFSSSNSILDAECIQHSQKLSELTNIWSNVGVNLKNLKCYRIVTNTSNSLIEIFASNFEILPMN